MERESGRAVAANVCPRPSGAMAKMTVLMEEVGEKFLTTLFLTTKLKAKALVI